MVALSDLTPLAVNVAVKGKDGEVNVPVYGVSAKGLAVLCRRMPQVMAAFLAGKVDQKLFMDVPEHLGAIIACGVGHPGEPEWESWADVLPLETQWDFLEKIGEVTFRQGLVPFTNRVRAQLDSASVKETTDQSDTDTTNLDTTSA